MAKVKQKNEKENESNDSFSRFLQESKSSKVQKASIVFFEEASKHYSESIIYLRARYNGEKYVKSLAQSIKKGSLNSKPIGVKNNESLTLFLRSIEQEFNEFVLFYKTSGKTIDIQKIVNNILIGNNIINDIPTFNDLLSDYLGLQEKRYNYKEISKKTLKRTLHNAEKINTFFIGYFNKPIFYLEEINAKTVESFYNFLKFDKNLEPETIKKAIELGSNIYKNAIKNKWYAFNPFEGIKYEKSKSHIHEHLTESEFTAFAKLELFGNQLEQNILDSFYFQCLTGLSYKDLAELKKEHIKLIDNNLFIIKTRAKTNRPIEVYLFPQAIEVLKKHENDNDVFCFKTYSATHHNRVLKVLASLANINKPIATHWARRSFAQFMISNNASLVATQGALGHASSITTQKHYANTSRALTTTEMQKIENQLTKN